MKLGSMFLVIAILAQSDGLHLFERAPLFAVSHQVDEGKSRVAVRLVKPELFANVRPALSRQTNVPLRLPGYIPFTDDPKIPVYAIVESAGLDSYEIQIAFTDDCNGGNSCHCGTIRGSKNPLVENDGPRVPVALSGGIKGYFVGFKCGAHCDDAAIGWPEGGYHYSISLKAEWKTEMTKVANSAMPTKPAPKRPVNHR